MPHLPRDSLQKTLSASVHGVKRRRHAAPGLHSLGDVLQANGSLRAAPEVTADMCPVPLRDWETAVGSRIAARTRPIRLDRGMLVVGAASSAWAQELALLAEPILGQLRARGVAVTELRFRVGNVDPPERPFTRTEVRQAPPSVALPPELRDELVRVQDEALREAIRRAAARSLGWATLATSARRAARDPRVAAPKSAPLGSGSLPAAADRRRRP